MSSESKRTSSRPAPRGAPSKEYSPTDLEREQEIEAREKAATPGPFVLPAYGNGLVALVTKAGGLTRNVVADKVLRADADFFAHAREDISYLRARLREAREKLVAVKAHLVAQSSARFQDAKASYEVIDCILKGGD